MKPFLSRVSLIALTLIWCAACARPLPPCSSRLCNLTVPVIVDHILTAKSSTDRPEPTRWAICPAAWWVASYCHASTPQRPREPVITVHVQRIAINTRPVPTQSKLRNRSCVWVQTIRVSWCWLQTREDHNPGIKYWLSLKMTSSTQFLSDLILLILSR